MAINLELGDMDCEVKLSAHCTDVCLVRTELTSDSNQKIVFWEKYRRSTIPLCFFSGILAIISLIELNH